MKLKLKKNLIKLYQNSHIEILYDNQTIEFIVKFSSLVIKNSKWTCWFTNIRLKNML